jgi:hypothetical protein
MSIGPVLSGYLLESNKVIINEGRVAGYYPSSISYILVFSVGFIVAVITIILSFVITLIAKEKINQGTHGKMMG